MPLPPTVIDAQLHYSSTANKHVPRVQTCQRAPLFEKDWYKKTGQLQNKALCEGKQAAAPKISLHLKEMLWILFSNWMSYYILVQWIMGSVIFIVWQILAQRMSEDDFYSCALLFWDLGGKCASSLRMVQVMLGRGAHMLLVSSQRLNYLDTWFVQSKQKSLLMIGSDPWGPQTTPAFIQQGWQRALSGSSILHFINISVFMWSLYCQHWCFFSLFRFTCRLDYESYSISWFILLLISKLLIVINARDRTF